MHPRLSVSEMCTYPLAFGDELALWDELGIRQVGLLTNKVDAFGRDAAIAWSRPNASTLLVSRPTCRTPSSSQSASSSPNASG